MSKLLKSLSKRSSSTPEQHENTVTGEFEVAVADEPSSLEIMIKEMNARLDTQSMLIEELSAKIREQEKDQDGEEYMVPVERLEEKIVSLERELSELISTLAQEPVASEEGVDEAPESRMVDDQDLYAVVLTVSPDSQHARGKSMDYVRGRLTPWTTGLCKRHGITVVGGPWLDDSSTLNHPHVNLTVRGDPTGKFDGWKQGKGMVNITPVFSVAGWTLYAKRNHDNCTALLEGNISREQASLRMIGKERARRAIAELPSGVRSSVNWESLRDPEAPVSFGRKTRGTPVVFSD